MERANLFSLALSTASSTYLEVENPRPWPLIGCSEMNRKEAPHGSIATPKKGIDKYTAHSDGSVYLTVSQHLDKMIAPLPSDAVEEKGRQGSKCLDGTSVGT